MEMDGDSSDEVTAEALNGETKPDAAKLAQSAIIKQVSSTFLYSADVHIELSSAQQVESLAYV